MVTAHDECPLASVKVHLFAISHILVQEGCHQVSFHLVHPPGCLLVRGIFMTLILLLSFRSVFFVLVIRTVTCPGGLSWSAFRPQGSAGLPDTTIITS